MECTKISQEDLMHEAAEKREIQPSGVAIIVAIIDTRYFGVCWERMNTVDVLTQQNKLRNCNRF